MHLFTRRRLWAASSVVTLLSISSASASLPIFGGATFGFAPNTGYTDAVIHTSPAPVINNIGTAIGQATFRTPQVNDGGDRPLYWTPTTWSSLPTGPAPVSGVVNGDTYAINGAGTILYDSQLFSGATNLGYRAGRLRGGSAEGLGNLGVSNAGVANTHAVALNAAGVTVGSSSKWNSNVFYGNRAVRWSATGTSVEELSVLQTQLGTNIGNSAATSINAAGLTVGESGLYSNNGTDLGTRAVRWNAVGTITQLGSLGTNANGYSTATSVNVNDAGTIAGVLSKYDASHNYLGTRAARYGAGTTVATELGGLGTDSTGYTNVDLHGMNNTMIVGSSNAYFGTTQVGIHAAYWLTSGSTAAKELLNLGTNANFATSAEAKAINADNCIVGSAIQWAGSGGSNHAVLWTTVGTDTVTNLNTLLPANSGWILSAADGISDTGFVSGTGYFDPDGAGAAAGYQRHFSMLVPKAGTYGRGDANFDASINFGDLIVLAQHYNQTNASQNIHVGDFNLDGVVDFNDLIALAQHYNQSAGSVSTLGDVSFAADWALAQSLVPEPMSFVLLVAVPMLTIRRRATETSSPASSLQADAWSGIDSPHGDSPKR